MKKEIKDYLHLYLGCEIQRFGASGKQYEDCILTAEELYRVNQDTYPYKEVRLKLRKFDNMTEKEAKYIDAEYISFFSKDHTDILADNYSPELMKDLLKMEFDLFGLIEAGLAIDKTTIK